MTTFNDILDRTYTTLINDYRMDKLYLNDKETFYTFLGGFLVNSIDMFSGCLGDLGYHSEEIEINEDETETIYVFDRELTSKEIRILCLGVAKELYKRDLDDASQYRLHLSTKDFKSFSEAQNLQRRTEILIQKNEEFDRAISDYQLDNFDKLPFFGGE